MMAANTHTKGQVWLDRPSMISGLRVTVAIWMAWRSPDWAAAGRRTRTRCPRSRAAARMASIAGLTPVSGPGVEVVLSDSTRALVAGRQSE